MSRIFISYSRQDQLFARRLATDLVGLGAELWLDVDDIPAGMNWSSAIQQGLDKCEAMIVVISPYSMSSKNVEDEWQYYLDHNKAIVPVYLETGRMHFQLSRLQYIDFRTAPYEVALKELHHELRRLGLKLGPFSAENLSTESNFLDIRRVPPAERAGQLPTSKRNSRLPLIALAILLPILLVIGGLLAESHLFTAQPTPTAVVTALLVAPTTAATATVATVATDAPTQVPTVAATSIPTDVPPTATLAPGAMRTDKAGIEQAWVPAGCFTMGSDPKADPDTNNDEIPAHQVCITKGFWVDLYELSNAAFQKFTDAGGYKDQKYWSADGWKWETVASSNGVRHAAQIRCYSRGAIPGTLPNSIQRVVA